MLFGVFIVVGHNVFRVVPNEVAILFMLFWVSLRLRDGAWSVAGLNRPKSWLNILLTAILAPTVLQLGSEFVIQPLATHIWHRPEQVSSS